MYAIKLVKLVLIQIQYVGKIIYISINEPSSWAW